MLSGEFERKLRKLNNKLRIFCGDDDRRPAGLFTVVRGEYEQICSVDKNWVGEHTQFDAVGHILRAGWRRVLKTLIRQGYVDRFYAERVFNTHLPFAKPRFYAKPKYVAPKTDLMEKYEMTLERFKNGRR